MLFLKSTTKLTRHKHISSGYPGHIQKTFQWKQISSGRILYIFDSLHSPITSMVSLICLNEGLGSEAPQMMNKIG